MASGCLGLVVVFYLLVFCWEVFGSLYTPLLSLCLANILVRGAAESVTYKYLAPNCSRQMFSFAHAQYDGGEMEMESVLCVL